MVRGLLYRSTRGLTFWDIVVVHMKLRKIFSSMAIGLLVMASSCGGSTSSITSSSTSNTNSGSTSGTAVGGNVEALTVTDGGSQLDLSDVNSGEDVVLMIYTYNQLSTSAGFEVTSSNNGSQLVSQFLEIENEPEWADETTEDFHGVLRDWEKDLDETEILEESGSESAYLAKFATTGEETTFKVLNSFSSSSSYDTVTATLRVQTDYFNIYVDNRDAASLEDSDLQTIANEFADAVPTQRRLFGNESDINNDGRFDILLTRTVNGLGGGSGMVTGFFYAVDLFSSDSYALSNEREVFYTFVPDPNGSFGSAVSKSFAMSNIYPGVMPHEYQHLISFNMHSEAGGSSETGWLNEGLSHLAEDIHSANDNDYLTTTGLENPARVSSYLASVANICFTCGTSLSQRGGSYLFVRYLYEQAELGNLSGVANGKTLLNGLLNTSNRSFDNVIQVVFGSSGTETEFQNLLGLFGLAVYLSDSGSTTDNRLGFTGLNLRSVQSDNRGTVLNGPAIQSVSSFPYSDSLSGSTISFMQASGSAVENAGGSLDFDFSGISNFGGYVIRE